MSICSPQWKHRALGHCHLFQRRMGATLDACSPKPHQCRVLRGLRSHRYGNTGEEYLVYCFVLQCTPAAHNLTSASKSESSTNFTYTSKDYAWIRVDLHADFQHLSLADFPPPRKQNCYKHESNRPLNEGFKGALLHHVHPK